MNPPHSTRSPLPKRTPSSPSPANNAGVGHASGQHPQRGARLHALTPATHPGFSPPFDASAFPGLGLSAPAALPPLPTGPAAGHLPSLPGTGLGPAGGPFGALAGGPAAAAAPSALAAAAPATAVGAATGASNSGSGGLSQLLGGLLGGKGGGAGYSLGQVQQWVERLGGIEGIMNTLGKVQQTVKNVQQMTPLFKLLLGSFKQGQKATRHASTRPINDDDHHDNAFSRDDASHLPAHRQRRRRRKTNTQRHTNLKLTRSTSSKSRHRRGRKRRT